MSMHIFMSIQTLWLNITITIWKRGWSRAKFVCPRSRWLRGPENFERCHRKYTRSQNYFGKAFDHVHETLKNNVLPYKTNRRKSRYTALHSASWSYQSVTIIYDFCERFGSIVEGRYFRVCFSNPGDIVRNPPNWYSEIYSVYPRTPSSLHLYSGDPAFTFTRSLKLSWTVITTTPVIFSRFYSWPLSWCMYSQGI